MFGTVQVTTLPKSCCGIEVHLVLMTVSYAMVAHVQGTMFISLLDVTYIYCTNFLQLSERNLAVHAHKESIRNYLPMARGISQVEAVHVGQV